MIRVVVDPGVFISALIGRRGGAPDLVVRAFVDDRIEVFASPLLLAELEHVLQRPKFSRYADARTRQEFVERVRRHATIVADAADQPVVTRDRKDDYLVALGRDKRASMRSSAAITTCWMPGWRRRRCGLPASWRTGSPKPEARATPRPHTRTAALRASRIVAVGSTSRPRANSRNRCE